MANPSVKYVTTELAPEDEPKVRELFQQVFDKPMSESLWQWKYFNATGHGTLVWSGEGELVAHYGGMGRDILYFGRQEKAVQITDVMVKHSARKSVRHNSPFYLAGKRFLVCHVGYGKPYLLGFGFPSDRAMGLGRRLGFYAPIGKMVETVWDVSGAKAVSGARANVLISSHRLNPPSSPGLTGGPSYPAFDKHTTQIDTLWQALSADLTHSIVAIKNAAFLQHRYLHHPEHHYALHLVKHRLTRKPLGLIVLRHQADHTLLMDVIAPFKHFPALIKHAAAQTAQAGNPQMKTWSSQHFAPLFQVHGATQNPLPITTPTNILTPGPKPEDLQDKWWFMPGDTDFL